MNREIKIMNALEAVVRTQFNDRLAKYNSDGIAATIPDRAIKIFDYGEALKSNSAFILLNSYTEPSDLQQNARELFVNLILAVAVFWVDTRVGNGAGYRRGAIYKSTLADLLSDNYNRITGSKKYSWRTIEMTEIEGGPSEYLMVKGEIEAIIDIRRVL